ncbi:MAG TPA: hypothetical protein VGH81_12990 [Rudaea sp.]|jgi:hypothetical protein
MRVCCLLLAILAAPVAHAGEQEFGKAKAVDQLLLAESRESFGGAAESLRLELRPGGRYAFIDDRDKWRVELDLVQMANLFRVNRTIDGMNRDQKSELLTLQKEVSELLRHNEASRFYCVEHWTDSSKLPVTICRTLSGILLWPPGPL